MKVKLIQLSADLSEEGVVMTFAVLVPDADAIALGYAETCDRLDAFFDAGRDRDKPEEVEEEEEEKPKRGGRMRNKRSEESPDPKGSAAPTRGRRTKKQQPEPEEETPEEKPARRRRASKGPTKEDVAKAASEAAEVLGSKLTQEIVADYAESGKIDDIPEDKRKEFIAELNDEMQVGEE